MVAWGAILKGVVSIAPSVIGLFKKKNDEKNGETPETVSKDEATTKQSLLDVLGGALSGAASGSAGGVLTTILGALAGGGTSLFKQKKNDEVKTNFVDSLLGNVGTNGIIGLLSLVVSLFKGNKEDKSSDSTITDARNVLANARSQNNPLEARLTRLEAQMGGPRPQFGGFNVGSFPPAPMGFPPRPGNFGRPVVGPPPVFRGPQFPRNHAVTRIMPNNFGRMM